MPSPRSRDDVRGLHAKSSSKSRLLRVLVFGLLLYTLDVGLHISIASHYLDMRECHAGVTMSFDNFNLADALGVQRPPETTTELTTTTTSTVSANTYTVLRAHISIPQSFTQWIPNWNMNTAIKQYCN